MKRLTAILLAMTLLLCSCSMEWEDTASPDAAGEDRSSVIDHINANMAATQDAFYYESDGAILKGTIEMTGGEKIAGGQLIGTGAEQVYYKAAGKLYARSSAGRTVVLAETEEICYPMESALGKDLLFIGEKLYLINENDPEDRVGYILKNHAYACLGEDSIYWYRLEEGNRATLCKTDLSTQEAEELCTLGYIGTAKPYLTWYEGRLYFYYGYSLYCYDPLQGELRTIKECVEGDHCVFWDGKAYLDCRSNEENRLEVVDLKTAKVLRTEEGAVEGLSSGRHGVAYQLEDALIVENSEEILCFSIGKNETFLSIIPMEKGILAKATKEYRLYSNDGALISKF